jgi:hypothetical protein
MTIQRMDNVLIVVEDLDACFTPDRNRTFQARVR